jgi:hypothetical protein
LTLHEIPIKIASKYLANAPHQTSVRPGFIEEMTRPDTNDGVSRQKLATFRRKIDALGRGVKGAQQRKTRRG